MKCSRCGTQQKNQLCDACYRLEKDNVTDHDIERLIKLAGSYGLKLKVTRDKYQFSRDGKATGLSTDNYDTALGTVNGYALHFMD